MSVARIDLPGGPTFSNEAPLVLIGGMNVIEDRETLFAIAAHFVDVTRRLGVPYVFKASHYFGRNVIFGIPKVGDH